MPWLIVHGLAFWWSLLGVIVLCASHALYAQVRLTARQSARERRRNLGASRTELGFDQLNTPVTLTGLLTYEHRPCRGFLGQSDAVAEELEFEGGVFSIRRRAVDIVLTTETSRVLLVGPVRVAAGSFEYRPCVNARWILSRKGQAIRTAAEEIGLSSSWVEVRSLRNGDRARARGVLRRDAKDSWTLHPGTDASKAIVAIAESAPKVRGPALIPRFISGVFGAAAFVLVTWAVGAVALADLVNAPRVPGKHPTVGLSAIVACLSPFHRNEALHRLSPPSSDKPDSLRKLK